MAKPGLHRGRLAFPVLLVHIISVLSHEDTRFAQVPQRNRPQRRCYLCYNYNRAGRTEEILTEDLFPIQPFIKNRL